MSSINLTAEQQQLVVLIDRYANQFPHTDTGEAHLLTNIYDYMDAFKMLMDSTTAVQMDYLCRQYSGFYRFAKQLEKLAQGLEDGVIEVPADH